MMDASRVLSLVAVLLAVLLSVQCTSFAPIVKTSDGALRGVQESGSYAYKGIPFAAPPVGDFRWETTQPPSPWSGIYNATEFSAGCPQHCVLPPHTCSATVNEDCLYLNVFTPLLSSFDGANLPVMVFIPGGRFQQGSGGVELYSGNYDVNSSNVVLVTISYRLGALGLLRAKGMEGNYALDDQRAALRWVQKNIGAFGGNPSNVTLYGQSAGAMSLGCHLVSPASKGLFQRAISESNPFTLPMYTEKEAETLANRFAKALGCSDNDVGCMKSKSYQDVVDAEYKAIKGHLSVISPLLSFVPWTPVVVPGGDNLPVEPLSTLMAGHMESEVPVVFGTVWNEALLFVYEAWNHTLTGVEYVAAISDIFLEHAPKIYELYPIKHDGDHRPLLSQVGTDYIFACPNRAVVRATSKLVPSYSYVFNHVISFDAWGPRYAECVNYVCHGSELPFIFNTGNLGGYYHFTPEEETLSHEIVGYWTNFAHSSNPNVGPTKLNQGWPTYDPSLDEILEFATPRNSVIQNYNATKCAFFDKIGYQWGLGFAPRLVQALASHGA